MQSKLCRLFCHKQEALARHYLSNHNATNGQENRDHIFHPYSNSFSHGRSRQCNEKKYVSLAANEDDL